MEISVKTPQECSKELLQSFYNLVMEGEQVPDDGLADRIFNCHLLGFAHEEKELIAVTAVKNPNQNYKNSVFTKAGVPEASKQFPFEIGYAFTKKVFRGRGIHQQLVGELIKASGTSNFYATTKAANVPYILEKIGFRKTGNDYKNDDNEVLQLFTYIHFPNIK